MRCGLADALAAAGAVERRRGGSFSGFHRCEVRAVVVVVDADQVHVRVPGRVGADDLVGVAALAAAGDARSVECGDHRGDRVLGLWLPGPPAVAHLSFTAAARERFLVAAFLCPRLKRDYKPRQTGLVTLVCEHCGTEFQYVKSSGRLRMYCSATCKFAAGDAAKKQRAATEPRVCACGSADVAKVGKPVCPSCRKDPRSPELARAQADLAQIRHGRAGLGPDASGSGWQMRCVRNRQAWRPQRIVEY